MDEKHTQSVIDELIAESDKMDEFMARTLVAQGKKRIRLVSCDNERAAITEAVFQLEEHLEKRFGKDGSLHRNSN